MVSRSHCSPLVLGGLHETYSLGEPGLRGTPFTLMHPAPRSKYFYLHAVAPGSKYFHLHAVVVAVVRGGGVGQLAPWDFPQAPSSGTSSTALPLKVTYR